MAYAFTKTLDMPFDAAISHVTEALKGKGFGVLTTIDVKATMKAKIDKDIAPYTILGACNPGFAYKAIQAESLIGTMLPCNVVVREIDGGKIEVAGVDPIASMQAIENPALGAVATEVQGLMKEVIASL